MTICITFDVERDWHLTAWRKENPYKHKEFKMIEKAIPALLKIADEYNIPYTFLICGDVAESCSFLFEGLTEHCIGVHTHPFTHENTFMGSDINDTSKDRLCLYPFQEQFQMISTDLNLLQDNFGVKPTVFRAGKHSANEDTFKILDQLNFKIDCSMHWGYQFIGWKPFEIQGTSIWEIPTYCDLAPETMYQGEILFKLSSFSKSAFSGIYSVIFHPMVFGNPSLNSSTLLQNYERWIEKLVKWDFDFLTIPKALDKGQKVRNGCNRFGKGITFFMSPMSCTIREYGHMLKIPKGVKK